MSNMIVKVSNASKSYGKVRALHDVSFEVEQGEIFGIIGPNGSGKTTLVESIEGLRRLTKGTISVLGFEPYHQRKEMYKYLGVQLQDTEYPEGVKVKEICEQFSSFYKDPADYRHLLKVLGLEKKENRKVKKLSGGEKQRLSIVLAILPKPKLLILDELTTGLDPEVRNQMWRALKMIKESGVSVILISHYLDEVEKLCDRFLYLFQGESQFVGNSAEFREFAKSQTPQDRWKEGMSLEEIYLMITKVETEVDLKGVFR